MREMNIIIFLVVVIKYKITKRKWFWSDDEWNSLLKYSNYECILVIAKSIWLSNLI